MIFFKSIEQFIINLANTLWNGPILITVLLGGGIILLFYSKLLPFKYIFHSLNILKDRGSSPSNFGKLTFFQTISAQIGTIVGLGNISGVAVAIVTGGPGAIFWMWVTAFFGMITKFYTCSLAVLYRGKDSKGNYQGGPMYVIREGLGKKWNFLALIFCFFGLFGVSPIFQANQIIKITNSVILQGFDSNFLTNFSLGLLLSFLVALVIFGGIKRIGKVASKLVPLMVISYMGTIFYILILNYNLFFPVLKLIIMDAFSANSVLGGAVGSLILIGARRAAFSNEAGVGTSPIIHAASKNDNPIKEGLVAMVGPFVDTIIVCTLTAFSILVSGIWDLGNASGIQLVLLSFEKSIPYFGKYILFSCTFIFAITTLFGNSYFGERCLSYLVGEKYSYYYRFFYISLIIIGSVSSLDFVLSLIDLSYGIMIFPTMISTLILMPKINALSVKYFEKI
tara:strand:- start:1173 stop:2528 length:1356 start_codon:yes stop_codon:yes gene_type:complete